MRNVNWEPRDERDFAGEKMMVTITLMEYRELVSKAALYDEAGAAIDYYASSPSEVEGAADDARRD